MEPCPPSEALAAFLDDRLTEDQRSAVARHAERCERCRDVLRETRRFLDRDRARSHPRWALLPAMAVALAAAVLLMLLLLLLLERSSSQENGGNVGVSPPSETDWLARRSPYR